MKNRVLNQNGEDFHYYGGRGIMLCERWLRFENFLADMGERPLGLSLDRVDNDGPYTPENCRWADQRTQRRNSRSVRRVTIGGRELLRTDAARLLGISVTTVDRWERAGRLATLSLEKGEVSP